MEKTWGNRLIYMIMIDRFADGDRADGAGVDREDPRGWHGGDLQGILEHLDLLQELGVGAIWISPFFLADRGGYHGYWPVDFERVEPRFGDAELLALLVEEAHRRDILILFDMVLNHTGPGHPWRSDPARANWYHHRGTIQDFDDPVQVLEGDLGGLPDLAQENPEVADYLIRMSLQWRARTGVDGFRLDAARHVGLDFWRTYTREVGRGRPDFLFLGEIWADDPAVLARYQEAGIQVPLDFPMYFAIRKAFVEKAGALPLTRALGLRALYPHRHRLGVFVDNHDVPRFVTAAAGHGGYVRQRLQAAVAFALTIPGIPVVTWGTEIAMEGGDDPDNRRDMDFRGYRRRSAWFRRLARLRRKEPALAMEAPIRVLLERPGALAYQRQAGSHRVVALFNLDDRPATLSFRLPTGPAVCRWSGAGGPPRQEAAGAAVWRDGPLTATLGPWEASLFVTAEGK